ncbi:MAG: FHA domain-containing protein [Planctomycetes bacterium]|jgi:pSer/pThr/pTyr-binding forkhead associated (FHA) protein|nr:FHA domain-containing protein [Planctomycetota bacterium]MCL4730955.1 FHA domain-containing protein [Planctomycetota bacterium]
MSKKRGKATDDFASDSAAPASGSFTVPTKRDVVQTGFEEIDTSGEKLFHAIVTDVCTVGRDSECNIVIRGDSKVSRKHAIIERKDIAYWIRDNDSSNGVIVNGRKITAPHELKVGDEVQIGLQKWTFARRASG